MISYGKHSITDEDIALVEKVLRSDFLTTGPLVELFESELEKVVGAPCVSVSSGTAALHAAYAAINIQPGDEIITPPITFIATQATAGLLGAKIVFADVQIETGNIDPKSVEKRITKKTKAIVAVDFAGHPAELDYLRWLADTNGLYLIEDASHSLGSKYRNRTVGSIADLTTFSFFPTKNITTGEGGAVSSINPELLERVRTFSRQGLIREPSKFMIKNQGKWHQEVHKFGLNYRLPDILCALGVSQLKRIEKFKTKRNHIFDQYMSELKDCSKITFPIKREYTSPMWHLFAIHVPAKKRNEIYNALRDAGILVQINYMPAYWHPVFSGYNLKVGDFPKSDKFYNTEISLPIHTELTEKDMDYIIDSIKGIKF